MEKEKKVYPKVEDLLPEGTHILKVSKQREWKDGAFVDGSHKKGTSQFGNWYIYTTKIEDQWVTMFANDENKEFFDTGVIEANVVPKRLKGSDDDLFDATGKKLLKAFYNKVKDEVGTVNVEEKEEEKTTSFDSIEF